jgi:two-component system sensor histidine kinase ChiS
MTLKLKTLTHFERGLLHYHSEEFSESKQYFEQVLTADPEDKAAQLYIQRVDYFLTHGVPLDWTGIESMK